MTDPSAPPPVVDWQAGRISFPTASSAAEAPTWSCIVCGDWAPFKAQLTTALDRPERLYGNLLPVLRQADLALVNVEAVLSDDPLTPLLKDGRNIRVSPGVVAALACVPFQIGCLANNHIYDFGATGLARTQQLLALSGIRGIGAGESLERAEEPAFVQIGAYRLAIINVAEGEEARAAPGRPGAAPLDLSRLQTRLPQIADQADVVLVVAHAGREYLPVPAPYIRDTYRSLVEAGADIVIGHHPHVAQGLELYQGALIAYSLGNFAFWLDTPVPSHRLGYFVKLLFRGPALGAVEIWPYQIMPDRLELLAGEPLQDFLGRLEELSAPIGDTESLNGLWNAYADLWLAKSGWSDLTDRLAFVAGGEVSLQSYIKTALTHFGGGTNRVVGRALWHVINRLGRVYRSVNSQLPPQAFAERTHAAAVIRNRFSTAAHRELYLTALERVRDNQTGQASDWARQCLADWKVFW